MTRPSELIGKRFERLVVIKRLEPRKGHMHWLCKCDCGNFTEVSTGRLNSGQTKSCGCLQKERAAENKKVHGLYYNEGGKKSKLYRVWSRMKERCFNPNSFAYKDYGGRGIRVCDEWLDYEPFHKWSILNNYREGFSIERVDNDGNYEPSNCKWIPISQQASNRRSVRYLTFNGQTMSVTEWGEKLDLKPTNILTRLRRGWTVERALTTPDDYRRKVN